MVKGVVDSAGRWVVRTAVRGSALLCLILLVIWVRSYYATDDVTFALQDGRFWDATWGRGLIQVQWGDGFPPSLFRAGAYFDSHAASAILTPTSFWTRLGYDKEFSADWKWGVVIVPFYAPAAVAAVLPSAWLLRVYLARRRRRRPWVCPGCGYDLRASTGRCPECGRTIPPQLARRPRVELRPETAGGAVGGGPGARSPSESPS